MDGYDKIFKTEVEIKLARQACEARITEREQCRLEILIEEQVQGVAALLEYNSETELKKLTELKLVLIFK